ncbi:DB module family protein [Brugia pahangi]
MGKLSVVLIAVLLIQSYWISYACIGLGGRSFYECYLDHFCSETDFEKSLKVRDERNDNELRFPYQARLEPPFISTINDESDEFLNCCRKRGLPEVCLQKCSYVSYNQNILRKIFTQADPCPLISVGDIHFCAAQGHDHRQCCVMNGRTQNGTIFDASYLPCFERFENIKECFWRWARRRYQLAEISKRYEIHESKTISDRRIQLNTDQPPSPFDNY